MIAAVIPVKRLAEAKFRLATQLTVEERSQLVYELLRRTLHALRESGVIQRIALATPQPELAAQMATECVTDAGDLNQTLARAVVWACQNSATSLLILPVDLPLIQPEHVRLIVASAGNGRSITIVRSKDAGTSALLLTPPEVIPPSFGGASFQRHVDLALARALPVREVQLEALAFDLDTQRDLSLVPELLPRRLSTSDDAHA